MKGIGLKELGGCHHSIRRSCPDRNKSCPDGFDGILHGETADKEGQTNSMNDNVWWPDSLGIDRSGCNFGPDSMVMFGNANETWLSGRP